ncbi:MAG: hypothetical protein JWL94_1065 [Microbacteriaceae bacterium]|nr:hypothetical protein [Microbacteriaceae bacterium]HEV7956060.1 hypothetical protein [Marisediminicola sp.]
MIESFLRAPTGVVEIVADLLRLAAVFSIAAAAVWWGAPEIALFALVLLGLLLPRFIEVRPVFDAAYGLALLVAAWSTVVDLYTRVPGWDLVVHFSATGLTAAMTCSLLAQAQLIPRAQDPRVTLATVIVLTASLGLALSALWEIAEWLGHTYVDPTIFVTYDDTIGDMAAGGLGSVVAGLAMKALSLRSGTVAR